MILEPYIYSNSSFSSLSLSTEVVAAERLSLIHIQMCIRDSSGTPHVSFLCLQEFYYFFDSYNFKELPFEVSYQFQYVLFLLCHTGRCGPGHERVGLLLLDGVYCFLLYHSCISVDKLLFLNIVQNVHNIFIAVFLTWNFINDIGF